MKQLFTKIALTLFVCSNITGNTLQAANLQISPLSVNFPAFKEGAKLSTTEKQAYIRQITLSNHSDYAATVQATIELWQQQDGHNVYIENDDFIIYPPLIEVAAAENNKIGSQIIRLMANKNLASDVEQVYRLSLQELPAPSADVTGKQAALALLLRINLPVFIAPTKLIPVTAESIQWNIQCIDNEKLVFIIENTHNQHAKLQDFTLLTQEGELLLEEQINKTLLAKSYLQQQLTLDKNMSCSLFEHATIDYKTHRGQFTSTIANIE